MTALEANTKTKAYYGKVTTSLEEIYQRVDNLSDIGIFELDLHELSNDAITGQLKKDKFRLEIENGIIEKISWSDKYIYL